MCMVPHAKTLLCTNASYIVKQNKMDDIKGYHQSRIETKLELGGLGQTHSNQWVSPTFSCIG